jgi:hypothetical protein
MKNVLRLLLLLLPASSASNSGGVEDHSLDHYFDHDQLPLRMFLWAPSTATRLLHTALIDYSTLKYHNINVLSAVVNVA